MTISFASITIFFIFIYFFVKRPKFRKRVTMSLKQDYPKGSEAFCPDCRVVCKLFIPKYKHLCPTHGWFSALTGEELMIGNKGALCHHVYPKSNGANNMPGPIVKGRQTFISVPHGKPIPGTPCKLCGSKNNWATVNNAFGKKFPHYFTEEEMKKINEENEPTETELAEVEVPSASVFCNFMTRKNTFCKVPIADDNPCGYHDSNVQKRQEKNLKATILELFNDTLETELTLSDLGISEEGPAHDLIRAICLKVKAKSSPLNADCDCNFTLRIDGVYVCTYCQAERRDINE